MVHRSWTTHFSHTDTLSVLTAIGLGVFVLQLLAAVGLLIWDAHRATADETTITEWAGESWWRVGSILGLVLVGWAGLALHLIGFAITEHES